MLSTLATAAGTFGYGFAMIAQAVFGMAQMVQIPQQNLRYAQELGHIEVYHTPRGFVVATPEDNYWVDQAFVDKEIRNFDNRQLMYWLGLAKDISLKGQTITMIKRTHEEWSEEIEIVKQDPYYQEFDEETAADVMSQLSDQGGYLEVVQLDDGKFAIHAKQRLVGGGGLGGCIGAWAGAIGTYVVFNIGAKVAIAGVAIVCPPAVVVAAPAIEAAANYGAAAVAPKVAAVTGIATMIATGPV